MDIVKQDGVRYHVGCGGVVIKGVCVKCGEKSKGDLLKRVFGEGPLVIKEEDSKEIDRQAHRRRLEKRKDIWK